MHPDRAALFGAPHLSPSAASHHDHMFDGDPRERTPGFAKREVKVEIDCTNFNKLPEYAAVANILRRLQFKVSVPGA